MCLLESGTLQYHLLFCYLMHISELLATSPLLHISLGILSSAYLYANPKSSSRSSVASSRVSPLSFTTQAGFDPSSVLSIVSCACSYHLTYQTLSVTIVGFLSVASPCVFSTWKLAETANFQILGGQHSA